MDMKVVTQRREWNRIVHGFPSWDVAHEWGYFEAYRARERERDSRQVLLSLEAEGGRVAYPFFLKTNEAGERVLEAVYGYTGPLLAGERSGETWERFRRAMAEFCTSEGIAEISEKFHPLLRNHGPLFPESEVEVRRPIVLIRTASGDALVAGYRRRNVRKRVRQAVDKGVSVTRLGAEGIDTALGIYRETMQRNQADAIYYFEREFFEAVFAELPGQCTFFFAEVEGHVAAFSLVLHSPHCAFMFLGGMDAGYRDYHANYLLEHEVLGYYHDIGVPYVNDGGGRTTDPDDSLLVFKRGFTSDDPVDYYVGSTRLNGVSAGAACD